MAKTQIVALDFNNLAFLDDGRINKLLLYHLQRAAQDLINRPGDKTARKVNLEFTIKPILDVDTGECDGSTIEIEAKSKMPVHRSKPYQMLVNNKGFTFNRDFPDSADQAPLFRDGDDEA